MNKTNYREGTQARVDAVFKMMVAVKRNLAKGLNPSDVYGVTFDSDGNMIFKLKGHTVVISKDVEHLKMVKD